MLEENCFRFHMKWAIRPALSSQAINTVGNWLKMGRIHAIMIFAKMIQIISLWHGGNKLFINPTVGKNDFPCPIRPTANAEQPISTFTLICQPNPASIWAILVNLSKETITSILLGWQNPWLVLTHSPSSLTFITSVTQLHPQTFAFSATFRAHSQATHAHNISEFPRYVKVAYV